MSFEVEKDLPSLRFEVFDILSFIQDHIVPFFSSENEMIGNCYFVAGDADVKRVEFGPSFSFLLPFFGRAKICHDFEGWAPSFELNLPVHKNGGWDNHEMRTPNTLFNGQMGEKGNSLDSLAQTHLISEDAVHSFVVEC